MDRRAVFFVGAAVVCALLIPAAPDDLRWVPTAMVIAYVVLAVWSYLDFRGRRVAHGSVEPAQPGTPDLPDTPDTPGRHDQPNRPVT